MDKNDFLIFFKIWVTRNIPTIHSSNWNNPKPGHSPRFDPKKLRESMKLNLSTEVFLTLTSSLNFKLNTRFPFHLVVVPSSTVATVLTQGRRQSDTIDPVNKSPLKGLINENKVHVFIYDQDSYINLAEPDRQTPLFLWKMSKGLELSKSVTAGSRRWRHFLWALSI